MVAASSVSGAGVRDRRRRRVWGMRRVRSGRGSRSSVLSCPDGCTAPLAASGFRVARARAAAAPSSSKRALPPRQLASAPASGSSSRERTFRSSLAACPHPIAMVAVAQGARPRRCQG